MKFTLDGEPVNADAHPWSSLRQLIEAAAHPLPTGCDAGHCGSCTVLLEGTPVPSCLVSAAEADGCEVATVKTAADARLVEAFAAEGAVQCGYCTPGMLVTLSALLRERHEKPLTAATVRRALDGNLCRCTGYAAIVAATLLAHREIEGCGIEA
ncbi:(2Fe-2S)-binding protein [Actinomadura rugatobispora]|uniref:(2Fe-2S)-binding protein n=1 Tax=Actinomadura rugatobispora TaxID=1994 RepID=A0ABW1A7N6_9ACTN|nr:xanthine dehydrogenase iron sulfur-binding subunit XdhC [Actinomadura rugatobispora]